MTSADLLTEAVAELYSCDPGGFVERRGVLAARARAAGDAPAAKRIAGLRKPTRSAWVLNQLARSAPDAATEVAGLGEELRAAQRSLDGAALRELSLRRRQLIDALARQAFTVSGVQSPSAGLRDEVTATLGAAVADPQFAEQLREGALTEAAHRDGFGSAAASAVAVLASFPGRAHSPAARRAAAAPVTRAAKTTVLADARERAELERHRRAIAAAEQAVAEADKAASAAARTEREHDSAVRLLEEQLTEARQRLAEARLQARRATAGQRRAQLALDRLQEHPPRPSSSLG